MFIKRINVRAISLKSTITKSPVVKTYKHDVLTRDLDLERPNYFLKYTNFYHFLCVNKTTYIHNKPLEMMPTEWLVVFKLIPNEKFLIILLL